MQQHEDSGAGLFDNEIWSSRILRSQAMKHELLRMPLTNEAQALMRLAVARNSSRGAGSNTTAASAT